MGVMMEKRNTIRKTLLILNTVANKKYIGPMDMIFYIQYPILSANKCKISSQQKIVLELEHNQLVLSKRYCTLSDDILKEISSGGYTVGNMGFQQESTKLVFNNSLLGNSNNMMDEEEDEEEENNDDNKRNNLFFYKGILSN